jgi:alpha-galactosidase
MFAGQAAPKANPYVSNIRIDVKLSSEDFVPDGKLNEKPWKNAAWAKFDHDAYEQRQYPQAETEVASLWTAKYVYFAFRCKYTTLNIFQGEDPVKERWGLWNRDVVEVFVNPQPERVNQYYEFEVSPNNQWIDLVIDLDKKPFNDAQWNSGFEHATYVDAQNHVWSCEMRIPLQSMGVREIRPNAQWRVNFFRDDGPGEGNKRRFLSWSPIRGEKRTYHSPTNFGLMRFVK